MITQYFMLSKVLKRISSRSSFIHINTLQHLVESELYFVAIVSLQVGYILALISQLTCTFREQCLSSFTFHSTVLDFSFNLTTKSGF